MDPSALVASFEELADPRVERTRVHRLGNVLVIAVLAVLAGADGWDDIVEWAEARQKWLGTFLPLRTGIPSADTVRRIFEAIDPKKFGECFHRLVAHLATEMPDQLIAIDGKTMRRTFSRGAGQGPLHVVSAWAVEQGVVLGRATANGRRRNAPRKGLLPHQPSPRSRASRRDHSTTLEHRERALTGCSTCAFDQDHSRVRDRNATMNLALLRKLALALLKRERSDPQKSIAMKRRRAGWDNDYLFTVLAAAAPDVP